MASYAPLFVNMNHRRWNPDLINFDSSRVYGLPSYYVQQMFSANRGEVVLPASVSSAPVKVAARSGAIGVGTWRTQAEFKDIRVARGDQVLFASDFSKDLKGWRLHGGEWNTQDGALRQTAGGDDIRAFIGDKAWSDYTLSLKARKIGGDEGFLISFLSKNEGAKSWWNIGGWGNSRHGLEIEGCQDEGVPGRVETGRWYDIRVEVQGARVRCYLDGKLVHDVQFAGSRALFASATRAKDELILKVVNAADMPQDTAIDLQGVGSVAARGSLEVLTSASPADENSLDQPARVAPVRSTIDLAGPSFRHTFPANSLTVLRLQAGAH